MFYKPTHTTAHATDQGWVDSKTGELLTSHKGLLTKLTKLGLDAEGNQIKNTPAPTPKVEEKVVEEKPKKTTKKRKSTEE